MKHLFIFQSLGKAIILTISMLFLMGAYSLGQNVTGKITDEQGQELVGATVLVKGTTTGTLTGSDGSFTIPASSDATLIVSYLGFERQEISVNGQSNVSVSLVQDFAQLDEVVVTGYGTQRKRDITAAIASVSEQEIKEIPVASTVDALKGRVAGVDIQGVNGRPGQRPAIQIRGQRSINASNDPLFVVDGVPLVSGGTAFDINPQDIESVEILKDAASTSIYGSRGANGVILITTKRGAQGGTQVNYDGFVGVTSAIKLVDMMNGQEFADMKRESRRQENGAVFWNGTIPSDENVFEDPVEFESIAMNRSTDYQDLVLNNGLTQNHQFGIRGGDRNTQFLMSANYYNEDGIIENMDFERASIRVNLDNQTTKWLKIGTSNLLTRSVQNFGSSDVMGEAASNNPLGYPYEADGVTPKFLPINDGIRTNPLSELVPGAWADTRTRHTIFTSLYAQADIAPGLVFRSTAGFEIRPETQGRFRGSQTNDNRGGPADARKIESTTFSYTLENLLTYDLDIGNSHLKITGLQSIQKNKFTNTSVEVDNLPFDAQGWDNLSTGQDILSFDSDLEEWQLASFMGRVNYDIAGKYLIQANIRADGSSRLAPGNQWASFPGVSVGWRVIEEDFMEGAKGLFQDLKLRASWGQVGNTSINPYETQGTLRRTSYDWNEGTPAFGYHLQNLANPNLSWETTTTLDIGLDVSLWKGRLNATIDWYQSNTENLLLERSLIPSSGFEQILFNVGETQNSGIEVSINSINIDQKDPGGFRWTTQLNWFANNEQIVSLASGDDDVANGWFIGQPVDVYFDFKKIGIWQSNEVEAADVYGDVPGEIKREDVNNDGVMDGDDRQFLGSDVPDWAGGLTNRFEYKGFDLSLFFFARVGHTIFSTLHTSRNSLFGRYNNLDVDYWTPNNPTNAYPRPNQNQERPRHNGTLGYFQGDYLKLRNATFGYNFGEAVTNALSISGLRVYVSAQNPWFISAYDSYDPEAGGNPDSNPGSNDSEDGRVSVDVPTTKMFLGGVNIKF
ncbi:MAG: TonB-dependent receptor [Bacteroidota bacterium]